MLSIYIMDICRTLGQFCDLGVPRLPRAISYYILVIGREGKGQSPLMAPGIFIRPSITYEGKWGILHILFIIYIFVERKRNTNNLIFKHYEK